MTPAAMLNDDESSQLQRSTMTTLSDDACYNVMTWMLDSDFTTTLNLNYATMLDSDALILNVND
eukprot:536281-Rhodomonas_salina.1